MKKQKKYLFIFGILFAVVGFFVVSNFVFAYDSGLEATKKASGITATSDMNTVEGITSRILGTSLTFLSLIFFGLIVFGGGRWMLARGNSDEIGKAQNTVIMAVIGLIIILGANALVNFVFISVGTGKTQSGSSTTLSCSEAHPGWEVLEISQCAGNNYQRNVKDTDACTAENNCDYLTKAFDVDTPANNACCLPYKSKCERSYGEKYGCKNNEYDCDKGTNKIQTGLCDEEKDMEGDSSAPLYCCESSEVWCLNISDDDLNFDCIKKVGQCFGLDDKNVEYVKDSYSSSQECRQEGEIILILLNEENK